MTRTELGATRWGLDAAQNMSIKRRINPTIMIARRLPHVIAIENHLDFPLRFSSAACRQLFFQFNGQN
jgi:hypothetical protein